VVDHETLAQFNFVLHFLKDDTIHCLKDLERNKTKVYMKKKREDTLSLEGLIVVPQNRNSNGTFRWQAGLNLIGPVKKRKIWYNCMIIL
jgi:hypothetical protein